MDLHKRETAAQSNTVPFNAELAKDNTMKPTSLNLGRKSKWLGLKLGIQKILNMLVLAL